MTAGATRLGRRLVARHQRVVAASEAGATMVEVIVAMIIMSICGAIFTGAMITLFRANNAAQAVTNSSQQTNQAYQALDKLLRYASGVSTPGLSTTGSWYVELSDTTTGAEVCTQLRVDKTTQVLQQRTWTAASPTATTSQWTAVASSLTNGSAAAGSDDQPFVLRTPTATARRQRLTVTLVSQAGVPSITESTRSSITLSLLNSSVPQPVTSICQQVGRP